MANPILSQPPVSFPSNNESNGRDSIDMGQEFTFTKIEGGYEVFDDENIYTITKPKGKIVCDCPEFKLAPPGSCDHIAELIERFGNSNGQTLNPKPQTHEANPLQSSNSLPSISKSDTALALEHPFREDQIKSKNGLHYIGGASVIQRLNDVLGTENWSFVLQGEPAKMNDEIMVRGRLTASISGHQVVKEDYGAHQYIRSRSGTILSRSDTVKAAVKDCIKRYAHQLGVGLHLYSPDGSFRAFNAVQREEN